MFLCLQEKIGAFPLFPENKLRWSLKPPLLSFHVLRNYIACYLHPQKYSLMFPKIPNIFQFLIVSYFHTFYFAIDSRDNHPTSTQAEGRNWMKELFHYLATYGTTYGWTPHTVTGVFPAELLFCQKIRTKMPELRDAAVNDDEQGGRNWEKKMKAKTCICRWTKGCLTKWISAWDRKLVH